MNTLTSCAAVTPAHVLFIFLFLKSLKKEERRGGFGIGLARAYLLHSYKV
jgi:hypothetical protein